VSRNGPNTITTDATARAPPDDDEPHRSPHTTPRPPHRQVLNMAYWKGKTKIRHAILEPKQTVFELYYKANITTQKDRNRDLGASRDDASHPDDSRLQRYGTTVFERDDSRTRQHGIGIELSRES
jgi:hypothetical protein